METTLESLYSYLDSLAGKPPLDELTRRVANLEVSCADLAPFIRFSDQSYTRNLVRAGRHYNVLVLCWKNGQRSPIHDHKGSSCAMARAARHDDGDTVRIHAPWIDQGVLIT